MAERRDPGLRRLATSAVRLSLALGLGETRIGRILRGLYFGACALALCYRAIRLALQALREARASNLQ